MPGDHPTRVLVCTQGFPRYLGDHHASFVLDHARALLVAGAEVTVCCPAAENLPDHDVLDGARVERFRYAPRRFETLAYSGGLHYRARGVGGLVLPFFFLGFLIDTIRHAGRADVIHAHWWIPSGLVAVIAGRLRRTPVVVHVHGTDAAMTKGPLRWPARWVLRRADAVIAVSSALADWVRDVAGVEAVVLPMPLRPSLAPKPGQAPPPPQLDGPVLAVGRLVPEKGFDVLVRAVALAGMPLRIVGDGGERVKLEALAHSVGADVTFVGPVPPDDVHVEYRACRIVAVPSWREGFGLVAAEAAAAGRAVVASDVGGLADIVTDGVNGTMITAGDVDALATALRDTDPSLGAKGPASITWLAPDRIGPANRAVHRDAANRQEC